MNPGGRVKKWLKWLSLGLLSVLLLFVFGWVPYFVASAFTLRKFELPDKENAGLTPTTFGLPFQNVSFPSRDGVPLSGWWVPAPAARGTVVLVHGLNRSRLEMVRKIPFLHGLGWNALAFDLRRHGASGGAARSLGWHERDDVFGAVRLARERAAGPVVLWGISFGGAASVLAAAEDPQVAGVVCDSAYRSLRDTAWHHLTLFRQMASRPGSAPQQASVGIRLLRSSLRLVPTWPTADLAVFWMGRLGGFDPDALDIEAAARRLAGRPALFVASSGDARMPPEIARELRAAAGGRASVLVIAGERHGHAYQDGTEAYEKAVSGLLEAAAGPAARMASSR